MKRTLLFLALTTAVHADFSDDQVPATPDVLARIVTAAERYGSPLRSLATKDEPTVYYLRRADYVGQVEAPFGPVHIARLFFIRSGVRGQQTPPARGHRFIVFLDREFVIRTHWTVDYTLGQLSVGGSKLLLDDKDLFDFAHPPASGHVAADGAIHPTPQWK